MPVRPGIAPFRRTLALAIWFLVAVIALGCSGDGDTTATTTPVGTAMPPQPTETPMGTAVATPTVAVATSTPQRLAIGLPLVAPRLGVVGDLDERGLPVGVVGPLVVYRHEVSSVSFADPWRPGTVEVVTIDLGRGAVEVGRVRFGGVQTPRVERFRQRLLVSFGRVVRSYALDGSDGVELRRTPEGMIERVSGSPDGTYVAINEFERWLCRDFSDGCPSRGENNHVIVLDAVTGDVVLDIPQDDERFDGFVGVAGPGRWDERGETFSVFGFTYSDGGGEIGDARVSIDGTVTPVDDSARFLRGETELVPVGALGCGLGPFDGYSEVSVRDAVSGLELNRHDAGGPLIDLLEISPDGTEVLVGFALASESQIEVLRDAQAAGECAPSGVANSVNDAPRALLVLGRDGGQWSVGSRLEVHRRWYAERVVTFACGDDESAGFGASAGVWRPAEGSSYGLPRRCEEPIEVRVDGVAIGGGRESVVLGFVELD